MRKLLLYTTTGCHLCEQAEQILAPVVEFTNRSHGSNAALHIELSRVEIADSLELLESYGVRIPVIRFADGGGELNWPFDQAQAFEFFSR